MAHVNEIEIYIMELFAELLECDESDIHLDGNFIDLGGHSLLALQVVEKLAEDFEIELSLRSVFELNVDEIAAEIAMEMGDTAST